MEKWQVSATEAGEGPDSTGKAPRHGWSDRTADTVGILVILAALILGALHFISGGLTS